MIEMDGGSGGGATAAVVLDMRALIVECLAPSTSEVRP